MFRKSVSFFILVALFWILIWMLIPDATPGVFSFTDLLRGLPLLFSFGAFGFALLMLFIRFVGVDLIARWIPHAGTVWWLGQHAYRFSQPKITLALKYIGKQSSLNIKIENGQQTFKTKLQPHQQKEINIGVLQDNPLITFNSQNHPLQIQSLVKRLGKNMCFEVHIDDDGVSYHRQQKEVINMDALR